METAGWRLREDLELRAAGGGMWVLKDPLRLSYFQMSAAELSLLRRAGDGATFDQLSAELALEHPDFDWSAAELRRFLAGAVRAGLMCSILPGNRAGALQRPAHAGGLARFLRGWWSLVSIRWRGIDPDRLLKWLRPVTSLLLLPTALSAALLLVLLALGLTLVQHEALLSELPGLTRFLAPGNLLLMTAALILIRGLHELGHAAVCSYFGGECRELGMQFTLFVPFPYCDVSDSWLWPERWKRMAVAGAGMGVEFVVAALCALIWTCTHPGLLHDFCLNVMLLCSLNTLLVNGNPLLRYDGYYLLSDFCGVPNLAEAGSEEALNAFRRLLTGNPPMFPSERSVAARVCLAVYGICASVYRLIITAGLLVLVYRFVEPAGLGGLAIAPGILALLLTAGTRLQPLLASLQASQNRAAAGWRLAIAAGLLGALLFVPVSVSLRVPFLMTPGNAVPVYVRSAGQVQWLIPAGTRVQPGDVLARLRNGDLELKIAEAEGEIARRLAATAGLQLRQLESGSGESGLAAAEELLESARRRLEVLKTTESELTIRSPRAGIVFPSRNLSQMPGVAENRHSVFGTTEVLDTARRGAWLEPQTELCSVGEFTDLRALACVRQSDIDLLPENAAAELRFDSAPGRRLPGAIESVSGTALQTIPPELVLTQRIPTNAEGTPESGDVWYPASVRPTDTGRGPSPVYATGTALLQTAPASAWSRLRRLAGLTFTWPF